MSTDEMATVTTATTVEGTAEGSTNAAGTANVPVSETLSTEADVEKERSGKILKAKELYSHGSRNFLVKSYAEAADELSQVCALYEELHGELSDELGMPYLLYGKSLIALALDENKVIDVPDEEEDEEEDDDDEEAAVSTNGDRKVEKNGEKLEAIKEDDVDSTAEVSDELTKNDEETAKPEATDMETENKTPEESQVSSTDDDKVTVEEDKAKNGEKATNGCSNGSAVVNDGEKPSTSNGEAGEDATAEDDEENEAASNLQLAWEILELAAKIFTRQGERGRSNLAEVQTELGNIEFENNLLEAARSDYERALSIYETLPTNYRRAMAEIHYKIGLSHLMQQQNKEGAASLKEACKLIADEIEDMKAKPDPTDKEKNNIQDMEETKQEIEAKIIEIEETQAQNVAEVRAALDSYIKPLSSGDDDACSSKVAADAATASSSMCSGSGSSSAITSSSKPTDISHLIKRKKPEDGSSEAEAVACSPAKRPAV